MSPVLPRGYPAFSSTCGRPNPTNRSPAIPPPISRIPPICPVSSSGPRPRPRCFPSSTT